MEILLKKVKVPILNWYCWYYEEILDNYSEIMSGKLGKTTEKSKKTSKKKKENISHKLFKKHMSGNVVKFSR